MLIDEKSFKLHENLMTVTRTSRVSITFQGDIYAISQYFLKTVRRK